MDRPTPAQQTQYYQPGPSTSTIRQERSTPIPIEEIDSETEQEPLVLEEPAINWARYVEVKSVQYVKMGHAPKIFAEEDKNWDVEQAVRETERKFSTDVQLLITETTNDPNISNTLVCLERH